MNDFETTLRATLDDDVGADAHQIMTDVRRGARRRRNRRRAVLAGGAAAVVAVGSFGAARYLIDDGPQPADGSSATSPTHIRAMAAAADSLLVASYEPDCECSVLWRRDGEDWERLRTMSGTSLRLSMAPNGTDGIMMRGVFGSTIQVTHDGGETWTPLTVQGASPEVTDDGKLGVWAFDRSFWVIESESTASAEGYSPWSAVAAWRGPSEGDSVTQIELPDFAPRTVGPVDEMMIAVRLNESGSTTPFVLRDGGATWQQASWPCRTDSSPSHYYDRRGGLQVLCDSRSSDQLVLYRTTDMAQWENRGPRPDALTTWQLGPDRALLVTTERTLVAGQEGVTEVDLPMDPDEIQRTATHEGRHYLATSQDIYESTDGGLTWEELED